MDYRLAGEIGTNTFCRFSILLAISGVIGGFMGVVFASGELGKRVLATLACRACILGEGFGGLDGPVLSIENSCS